MSDPTPDPAKRASELIEALWNDKDLGSKVRSKAKELYSDIVIPEDNIDPVVAPLREQIEAMQKELAEERESRAKEREEAEAAATKRNLESALDAARSRFNLTPEGFDKMVERMKATGNYADPEAAAAWVAQQTPTASPSKASWLPKKIDLFGSASERAEEDYRLLHTNPIAFQDKVLEQFIQDPDGFVRETFAA